MYGRGAYYKNEGSWVIARTQLVAHHPRPLTVRYDRYYRYDRYTWLQSLHMVTPVTHGYTWLQMARRPVLSYTFAACNHPTP